MSGWCEEESGGVWGWGLRIIGSLAPSEEVKAQLLVNSHT